MDVIEYLDKELPLQIENEISPLIHINHVTWLG